MTSSEIASTIARKIPEITRWDQQLRAAKNSGIKVKFQLAIETYYADENCIVVGTVLETDKAGIKIISEKTGREHWVTKNFIVSTEVLDAI